MHWAIDRAYSDEAYARGPFGTIYDNLAPPSIDFLVGGRLVKLGREQGEYFVMAVLVASVRRLYGLIARPHGFASRDLVRPPFDLFPASVVKPNRKARAYVNAVLARSERDSRYPASRKLWVREAHGEYVPNPGVSVRGADGEWIPIFDSLGVDLFEEHLERRRKPLRDVEAALATREPPIEGCTGT